MHAEMGRSYELRSFLCKIKGKQAAVSAELSAKDAVPVHDQRVEVLVGALSALLC